MILTSVLTGLQMVPGSMTFSGACDVDHPSMLPRTGSGIRWLTTSLLNPSACNSLYNTSTNSNCACHLA